MPTVNTTIYGTPEQWEKLKTLTGDSDTLQTPCYPYFGETPTKSGTTTDKYMMGTLSTAYLNGKLQINTPIDLSICPIGCDVGFQARNVTYYPVANNDNIETMSTKVDGTAPLFFQLYQPNPSTYNYHGEFHLASSTNIERNAWAYDIKPYTQQQTSYNSLANADAVVRPITRMPVKDTVWCIFVGCCEAQDWANITTMPQVLIFDLNAYINGTVMIDGQSVWISQHYPEIIWVGVRLFTASDSNISGYKRFSSIDNLYGASFSQDMNEFQFSDTQILKYLRYSAYPWTNSVPNWKYLSGEADNNIQTDTRNAKAFILYGNPNIKFIRTSTKNQWYGIVGTGAEVIQQKDSAYYMLQHTNVNERWQGTENFKKFCLEQCAYFGMFFTDSYQIAANGELDDENMYLGIIDDSGITHGQYSQGQKNKEQKQWDWNDIINDSPYDPTKKPDPSIYDEETKLAGETTAGTAFLHIYECSYETINNLKKYLYQIVAPESTSETLTQKFLTVNPIDCITGCYEFPFTVRDRTSVASNIIIGNTIASGGTESPIVGYTLQYTLKILDFGSVYYYPFYDDFRDYEPYSEALLYIPYVGYIPISPSEFMGHNVGLKMICDLLTGSCQALVYKDGLVIESSSGNIGTQVPITGIQQADYSNAIHSASTRLLSSQVASVASFGGAVSSLVTGNALGAVSSIANVAQSGINVSNAKYELEHTKVPFKQSGTASPNVNFSNEQQARLILKRPLMEAQYNQVAYGKTVGFACLITAQLSSFTGFTQTTNVDLSGITATVTEKQMIQQLLQSGVYL